ncbi:MAG: cyclodeaminase/cyclohydrolase family protein [Candidatus Omnitrophota bacterium]
MSYNMALGKYLSKLADRTPVPGGGSAAALAAALGAALISMTAKYDLGKAKDKYAKKKIREISDFSEKALRRLELLMQKDGKAYLKLAKEIKKRRPKKLLRLYKDAISVPMEVCNIAARAASDAAELSGYSKTSIISDAAEAAVLLESAFFSAKLNVEVNLRSIEAAAYKKKVKSALNRAEKKAIKAKKAALASAAAFLKRG